MATAARAPYRRITGTPQHVSPGCNCCGGGGGDPETIELPCCPGVAFPQTIYLNTTGGPMYGPYPVIPAQANIPFILTFKDATHARYDLFAPASPYGPTNWPLGVNGFYGQPLVLSTAYIVLCDASSTIMSIVAAIFELGHGYVSFAIVGNSAFSNELVATLSCTSPYWTDSANSSSRWGSSFPTPATWTLHS